MDKLQNIRQFMDNGIAVIPLRHRGKEPESRLMGGTWERFQHNTPTEYQISRWFASGWQNYGVVCGWRGLTVIDFDQAQYFAMWFDYFSRYLLDRVYPMPYIVRSARGAHVYLSCPVGGNNEKRLGLDLKYHGYVVGPGSIHPSGTQYLAMSNFALVQAYDINTILPLELFPKIAPSPSCGDSARKVMSTEGCNMVSSDYDPFAAANGAGEDLITKVKRSVRIETLFADVRKTSADGRWLACLCPFHDDKNPSAWIDTQRQLFGCNSCNFKPLDAINLYARIHNMSESNAVSELAREIGVWG